MPRPSPLLTPKLIEETKKCLKSLGRTSEISSRLNAIISSYNHSISDVAKIYNTTNKTIRLWIKSFKDGGVEGLKIGKGRGRKPLLNDIDLTFIANKLHANSSITIEELRLVIREELGKDIGKTCCHNAIKACGYSYKTARKKHYKSNQDNQVEFKKN